MKKVLIDCGSNLGQGFELLTRKLNIDKDWEVIMFEPNENCIEILEKKITNFNASLYNKAVYTHDGKVNFNIPKTDNVSVGSTIHDKIHNSKYNVIYQTPIEVECVDLSKFINNFNDEFEIYLKLDIEGSELEVLEKMILDLSHLKIKKLFVEFHDQYVDDSVNYAYSLSERKKIILDKLFSDRVECEIWN